VAGGEAKAEGASDVGAGRLSTEPPLWGGWRRLLESSRAQTNDQPPVHSHPCYMREPGIVATPSSPERASNRGTLFGETKRDLKKLRLQRERDRERESTRAIASDDEPAV
jgi:hypothetical protein